MKMLFKPAIVAVLAICASSAALGADGWLTSYDEAVKQSKATKKPILANFTGSDWCSWCIKLKDDVFSKKEFKDWAKEKVILLELDFPQAKKQTEAIKKQNAKLEEKYKIEGYPTVLFLDASGKKLGESGYEEGGPKAWTAGAEKILATKPVKTQSDGLQANVGPASAAPEYPKIVTEKTLYAKTDLRGKKAPKVEAETWLSGKAPDLKGKVVVVDLWATWCGPCRELIPEMNEWAKKFKDDLVVIGISKESAEIVKEFMKKTPMNYHTAIDSKGRVSEALGVEGIPHVLVISADGIVRWQGFPLDAKDRLTEEKLKAIIDASKAASK